MSPVESGRSAAVGRAETLAVTAGPAVKLCGVTRLADLLEARALGAWAVGLVFAPSPRRLTPGEARDLLQKAEEAVQRTKRCACGSGEAAAGLVPSNTLSVLRPGAVDATLGPLTVGVFVDADADVVASLATYLGLAAVQLHGEGGATPAAVRRALTAAGAENGTLVIKAVGVEPGETDVPGLRSRLQSASEDADLVLIDARVPGMHGGTGRVVPWQVVGEAAAGMRFLLAGGINPQNAAQALAASGAWGLDVSSGVEKAPGIKDPVAMRALMATVYEKGRTQ